MRTQILDLSAVRKVLTSLGLNWEPNETKN